MERTDLLASRLGVSLRSLAPRMGLSVASLFGYRNGSIKISTKAWEKLEQAEGRAGIPASMSGIAENSSYPKDEPLSGAADPAYAKPEAARTPVLPDERLLTLLERIARALEELVKKQ